MKSILLLIAAVAIAVPSYGALESGDLVVLGSLPNPTPAVPALFNVKPNGTIETFSTSGVLAGGGFNLGPVVCPDGSIVVAKAGNWIGDATPTPEPSQTPMAAGFWRQSGVYRFQPNGSVSTVAEGGLLNPEQTSIYGSTSLQGIACDSKGNIFVSHGDYPYPTPTPGGTPVWLDQALLKIPSGSGTPVLFASETQDLQLQGFQGFGGMTVDAADNIFVPRGAYSSFSWPDTTPTPYPAKIFQVSGADGAISTYAAASSVSTYYNEQWDEWETWSEPFDWVDFAGTDIAGNLIAQGGFTRQPAGTGPDDILSFGPGGAMTALLDVSGTWVDLLGANGAYLGFGGSSIYILKAGSLEEEFIVHGDQAHNFNGMAYYSPEKPQLTVTCSEDVFGRSDSIAFGFGLTRGRTANEADLYFAIQFPASAGGNIKLINPNKAVNKLAPLIDLALAKKYPTQISKLRYGNGTTAVKGSGTVELLKFSNIVIPDGTYTLLGVMTAPGANLFDTSKWLTPNKKAVEAETTYSKAL